MQRQNGTSTTQSGTDTTHQNMIGTGTNHSGVGTDMVSMRYQCSTTHQKGVGTDTEPCGTGTNASNSPDIGILTLLSSNSHTEGIGTLINY